MFDVFSEKLLSSGDMLPSEDELSSLYGVMNTSIICCGLFLFPAVFALLPEFSASSSTVKNWMLIAALLY